MPGADVGRPDRRGAPGPADAVGPLAVVAKPGALPRRELAEQLVRAAARTGDPTHRVQAHDALGATLFQLGAYAAAWRHSRRRSPCATRRRSGTRRCTMSRPQACGAWSSGPTRCGAWAFPRRQAQRCQEALAQPRSWPIPIVWWWPSTLRPFCIATGGRCGRYGRRLRRSWRWPRPSFRSRRVWARLAGLGAGHAGGGDGGPGRDAPGPDAGRGRGAEPRAAALAGAARRGGGARRPGGGGRRLLAEALAAFAASGRGDLLAEAHRARASCGCARSRIRPRPTPASSRRWRSPGSSRPGPGSCAPR